MKTHTFLACLVALVIPVIVRADNNNAPIKTLEDAQALISTFKFQTGHIDLYGGLAAVDVPEGYVYLGPADAQSILVRLWNNPPGPPTLGMLLPKDVSPISPKCWAVSITYVEEGHVKDDDAQQINYDDLIKQIQGSIGDINKARTAHGAPLIKSINWAEPPHYNQSTHKLYWAKDIGFDGQSGDTLNYDIRILGRKGVLVLNAIAPIEMLPEIKTAAPQILAAINFKKGNQYNDFDSSTDKLATYGLAALVVGGVAAKMGLFKFILVGILAAKKFVIIGCAAIAGWFRKFFGKKERKTDQVKLSQPGQ